MDENNLHGLVKFLSEETRAQIHVLQNQSCDTDDLGTVWNIGLSLFAKDAGESRIYRSRVGPSAEIITESLEDSQGFPIFNQVLSSPLEGGLAVISLRCTNTRLCIVEDD